MKTSVIRQKWQQGMPALVTTLHYCDASIYEMTSLMGFDGIWMDLEHHGYSVETALELMRAARVGTSDIIARPGKWEYMRMSRLLEAGAQGIMYPQCDDATEAAEVVKWCKFPPAGRRGFDGANPDVPYFSLAPAAYVERANAETIVIIQIETPGAVERADEIAAVPGVDVLMLGPADLSLNLGIPGQVNHPRIREAEDQLAAAAARHGKRWGRPAISLENLQDLRDRGAQWLCYMADFVLLKRGLEALQADLRPLGFTFDNRLGA